LHTGSSTVTVNKRSRINLHSPLTRLRCRTTVMKREGTTVDTAEGTAITTEGTAAATTEIHTTGTVGAAGTTEGLGATTIEDLDMTTGGRVTEAAVVAEVTEVVDVAVDVVGEEEGEGAARP